MTRRYIVGLDMGGTNIRCAAVADDGRVLMMRRGPSNARGPAQSIAENIALQVRALQAAAGRRGLGSARAIGVAVPGPLDVYSGTVLAAPHVSAWREFPLRKRLEAQLQRRVVVENDANAWALGEYWRGAAKGYRNVVLLTLGTGVGGGLIVDGKIVHGRVGMAGELGHVTVEPDGLPCDCGAIGCLEAYASASGMSRLLERRLNGRTPPRGFRDPQGNFSVRQMASQARGGNRLAIAIFAEAGRYLGIAIASFLNIFNPELVVIGGGVASALNFMRKAMTLEVRKRAFPGAVAQARVVRAALGAQGGVVGAAYAAIHPVRSSD